MKKQTWITFMMVLVLMVGILSGCTSTASTPTVGTATEVSTAEATQTDIPATEEPEEQVELLVSAAASLTDVMAELADDYAQVAPNVKLTYTLGSSGSLQTQIEEGAPSDVFLSAGKKQMTALEEKGLLLEGTNTDLLENKIVLIVPKGSDSPIKTFDDAASDLANIVAVGEPSGVPVGQYTKQVFESLGLWDVIQAKANYGSDVRQVLTWVETGEADCGVVYSTDAMISDGVEIVCEAPEGSCDKIIYPAAVIGSSQNQEAAKAFLAYLSTPRAAAIFEEFGFTPIQ